jgi:hypothetical protein
MTCYICHKHTRDSFYSEGINFGFCEEHQYDVLKGVAKFVQTRNLTCINKMKADYNHLDYETTTDQAFD